MKRIDKIKKRLMENPDQTHKKFICPLCKGDMESRDTWGNFEDFYCTKCKNYVKRVLWLDGIGHPKKENTIVFAYDPWFEKRLDDPRFNDIGKLAPPTEDMMKISDEITQRNKNNRL